MPLSDKVANSNESLPFLARVCGLFVRDKSDLALVDVCNQDDVFEDASKLGNDEPTLFMASLGAKDVDEVHSKESTKDKGGITMGRSRNGSVILIDFQGRKRFIRINLDDEKGISITLQVQFHIE